MYEIFKDVLKNDTVQNEIKSIIKSFGSFLYNELYFYALIITIYCLLMFIFVLVILIYLLNLNKKLNIALNQTML